MLREVVNDNSKKNAPAPNHVERARGAIAYLANGQGAAGSHTGIPRMAYHGAMIRMP